MSTDRLITLSHDEWDAVKRLADSRTKANNGHSFMVSLKTRCQHCGRSPKARGVCRHWFQTFLGHLDIIVLNLDQEREDLNEEDR